MSRADDDPFELTPLAPPDPQAEPGEIARGAGWILRSDCDRLLLDHLTGELADRTRTIEITPAEAERLQDGRMSLDDVVLAHDTTSIMVARRL